MKLSLPATGRRSEARNLRDAPCRIAESVLSGPCPEICLTTARETLPSEIDPFSQWPAHLLQGCTHHDPLPFDDPRQAAGFYADRAVGRDRHHRRLDRTALAGGSEGPRCSQHHELPK